MGLMRLGAVQWAAEVTAGTPVTTATVLIPVLKVDWHEEHMIDQPEEIRANLAKYFRGDDLGKIVKIAIEGDLTYEEAGYLFGMVMKSGVSGVTDGNATPAYLQTFESTLTSPDAPATKTIQVGDDTSGDQFYGEYCFATDLEISAATMQRTRYKMNCVARQLTAQAFTSSLAPVTGRESALGQKWTLKVDDSGGTIGTTAYGGIITGMTWRLPQAFAPHNSLDGNQYFNSAKARALAPELDLMVEVDATAVAQRGKFTAGTKQLIRLLNTGSQIHGSTPTATQRKFIQIDGAYRLIDAGPIGSANVDEVLTQQLKFRAEYDSTWTKLFQVKINTALTALP